MSKIRLGFVGVGAMGQAAHLRNYITEPDCEVVAIAELRPKLRAAVAQRYGIAHAYSDHRTMLAEQKLDGIVASQPFGIHGQIVPDLLAAGVPVLTEKPIGRSREVAEKLVAASAASKGGLYIGHHKRSDPATVQAKQAIDEMRRTKEIGALRYVRICMPPGDWIAEGFATNLNSDDAYPRVPSDAPPAGFDKAGAETHDWFVNYYIHQVNLLRHLIGESYEARYIDPTPVVLSLVSASGIPAVLEMAPYSTTTDWQEHALVCFDKGWVRIDLPAPLANGRPGGVTVFKDPGGGVAASTTRPTLPWIHAMRAQARAFIRACRGEQTELCRPEAALADIQVADRAIHLLLAARAGRTAAAGKDWA
jgi:predicted dehydrogenase